MEGHARRGRGRARHRGLVPGGGVAMRLRPVDWGVMLFAGLASSVALSRRHLVPGMGWLLIGYLLAIPLVLLVRRTGLGRLGRIMGEIYPLLLIVAWYGAFDVLTGHGSIGTRELYVERWELGLFGQQV